MGRNPGSLNLPAKGPLRRLVADLATTAPADVGRVCVLAAAAFVPLLVCRAVSPAWTWRADSQPQLPWEGGSSSHDMHRWICALVHGGCVALLQVGACRLTPWAGLRGPPPSGSSCVSAGLLGATMLPASAIATLAGLFGVILGTLFLLLSSLWFAGDCIAASAFRAPLLLATTLSALGVAPIVALVPASLHASRIWSTQTLLRALAATRNRRWIWWALTTLYLVSIFKTNEVLMEQGVGFARQPREAGSWQSVEPLASRRVQAYIAATVVVDALLAIVWTWLVLRCHRVRVAVADKSPGQTAADARRVRRPPSGGNGSGGIV